MSSRPSPAGTPRRASPRASTAAALLPTGTPRRPSSDAGSKGRSGNGILRWLLAGLGGGGGARGRGSGGGAHKGEDAPLRISVRAAYGTQQQRRPVPLSTVWALALLFTVFVVIPDANRRLMSLPSTSKPFGLMHSVQDHSGSLSPSLSSSPNLLPVPGDESLPLPSLSSSSSSSSSASSSSLSSLVSSASHSSRRALFLQRSKGDSVKTANASPHTSAPLRQQAASGISAAHSDAQSSPSLHASGQAAHSTLGSSGKRGDADGGHGQNYGGSEDGEGSDQQPEEESVGKSPEGSRGVSDSPADHDLATGTNGAEIMEGQEEQEGAREASVEVEEYKRSVLGGDSAKSKRRTASVGVGKHKAGGQDRDEESFWLEPIERWDDEARDESLAGLRPEEEGGGQSGEDEWERAEEHEEEEARDVGSVLWPPDVVLSMALGYDAHNLSVFVKTFQLFAANSGAKDEANVAGSAGGSDIGGGGGGDGGSGSGSSGVSSSSRGGRRVVLFMHESPSEWHTSPPPHGVVVQRFHQPSEGLWSQLPLWLTRFRLFRLFLDVSGVNGSVIISDSRDIAFLADPFPIFAAPSSSSPSATSAAASTTLHLFQEPEVFPQRTARVLPQSYQRVAECYGVRNAFALSGHGVISSSFLGGGAKAVGTLSRLVVEEVERLAAHGTGCLSMWGSDQAIINHLARSGLLRAAGLQVVVENTAQSAVLLQQRNRRAKVHNRSRDSDSAARGSTSADDKFEGFTSTAGTPIRVVHGHERFRDTNNTVRALVQ